MNLKNYRYVYVTGNAGVVGWVKDWSFASGDHTRILDVTLTLNALCAYSFMDDADLNRVLTYLGKHPDAYGEYPLVLTRVN